MCKSNTSKCGNTESNGLQPGGAASDESDVSEDSNNDEDKSPSSATVKDYKVCPGETPLPGTPTYMPVTPTYEDVGTVP